MARAFLIISHLETCSTLLKILTRMMHGQEEVPYLKVAHGGGSGGCESGFHATMASRLITKMH
jgi:hypothetical protein